MKHRVEDIPASCLSTAFNTLLVGLSSYGKTYPKVIHFNVPLIFFKNRLVHVTRRTTTFLDLE